MNSVYVSHAAHPPPHCFEPRSAQTDHKGSLAVIILSDRPWLITISSKYDQTFL
jgi:hypothetical protein